VDQLIDMLEHLSELTATQQKLIVPISFKLLDDNKNEIKSRSEKLIKKLHSLLGQVLLDSCPQARLQRVCDICLKSGSMAGTSSSGKTTMGTGTFGANGNSVHLNSRI